MTNAAKQLNLPKRSNRFLRVPLSLHAIRVPARDERGNMITMPDGEPVLRDLNFSDLMILGFLYSFSHMKKKPDATCVRSYSELEEETGFARSTLGESIWASKNAGIVKQIKHFHEKAEYQCVGFPQDEFYITFEWYLFTDKFYVPEEGKSRRLKKWEIWVISVLASMCNKPEAKGCDFTIEELCNLSGACEKTIRKAVCKVINMGFVSSRNRIEYARKWKRLHFNVPHEVRRLMKHEAYHAPEKSAESSRKEEEIKAVNMQSKRERYFARNYNAAVARAGKNRSIAMKDDIFKKAETIIRAGEIELARAEKFAPETVNEIRIKLEQAKKERANALVRLKLTDEDFEPQWKCKKCSDKGFLPNGRMCDCYDPPGGAP